MVSVAETPADRPLNLSLGTPEDVVNPPHPWSPNEKVRVGFIKQSNTWVLLNPSNGSCKDFRHLCRCSDDHSVDLEILDSMGMLEHEDGGPHGTTVIKLASEQAH